MVRKINYIKPEDSLVTVVIGGENGDEGKAKAIDYLLYEAIQDKNPYGFLARFQGGPNAGHTTYLNGNKHVSHQAPCAPFFEEVGLGIGPRVAVNPENLMYEYDELITEHGMDISKRLVIAHTAPIITPYHIIMDFADEFMRGKTSEQVGTTLNGIAHVYKDIPGRDKLTVADLLQENWLELVNRKFEKQKSYVFENYTRPHGFTYVNGIFKGKQFIQMLNDWFGSVKRFRELLGKQVVSFPYHMNSLIKNGVRIMAEGAQGTMIDVDYGAQPNVTSSNPISGGAAIGLGIAPYLLTDIVMVAKAAYNTKVGKGPFPSKFEDVIAEEIRKCGNEFGATTGRPRDIGWKDWVALRYAIMINGPTRVFLTKLDVCDTLEQIGIVKRYKGFTEDFHAVNTFDNQIGEVEYTPGWLSSTERVTDYNELPEVCKTYLQQMNTWFDQLQPGLQISHIGTGVDRMDTIRI